MRTGLLRGLPLAAALVAALVVTSVSGAGHDQTNFFHLGEINSSVGTTVLESNTAIHTLRLVNTGTGAPLTALSVLGSGTEAALDARSASSAIFATAVRGVAGVGAEANNTAGVRGVNESSGYGVIGESTNGSGVFGRTTAGAYGVLGQAGGGSGVRGLSTSGAGLDGSSTNFYGVRGETASTGSGATGIFGLVNGPIAQAPAADAAGVRGHIPYREASATNGYGVWGTHDRAGIGVRGSSLGGTGTYGLHQGSSGTSPGVHGRTNSSADLAAGVYGEAPNGSLTAGVYGTSVAGFGVLGIGGAASVMGYSPAGLAGYFVGNAHVTGTLTKGAGAFRIDHPLDPAHRYLQHSFVESPDMKNVYDGVVRTDRRGFATVRLPRYFQALNRSFRYQLTLLGRAAWGAQAVVWEKIRGNRFVIRSKPRVEVSWQVTGIRKDRYANAHRIRPELRKPAREQGTYLAPELYGQPRSASAFKPPVSESMK